MSFSLYNTILSHAPPASQAYVKLILDNVLPKVISHVLLLWALIGVYYLLMIVYLFLNTIWARFLRPAKNLKAAYGSWAVVTGATDGIGEAIAFELARKGLNIVLISRSLDKLSQTASNITLKYPKVQVKVIDVDFSNFNEAARAKVANELKSLDVGVLINNVGISYPFPQYFHELNEDRVDQLITVNITSTTLMTKIVLPQLVQKKKGAIVNISSFAGEGVSPLLAQYSAAKSYVGMFSRALHVEMADHGVHVQVQTPLFVATKLAKIKHASLFVPSPSGYARAAVASIGYEAEVSPFWAHALQLHIFSLIPSWLLQATLIKNMHYGLRKAGQKKEARLAQEAVQQQAKDKSS